MDINDHLQPHTVIANANMSEVHAWARIDGLAVL
jgi:hypothetical protein